MVLTRISTAVSPEAPLVYRVAVRNRGQAPVRDQEVQALLGRVDTRSELANLLAAPGGSLSGQQLDQFQPAAAEVAPAASSSRRAGSPAPGTGDEQAGVVLP